MTGKFEIGSEVQIWHNDNCGQGEILLVKSHDGYTVVLMDGDDGLHEINTNTCIIKTFRTVRDLFIYNIVMDYYNSDIESIIGRLYDKGLFKDSEIVWHREARLYVEYAKHRNDSDEKIVRDILKGLEFVKRLDDYECECG